MKTLLIRTGTQEVKIWDQINPVCCIGNRKGYLRKKKIWFILNKVPVMCQENAAQECNLHSHRELAQVQTSSLKIYKKLNGCYLMIGPKYI